MLLCMLVCLCVFPAVTSELCFFLACRRRPHSVVMLERADRAHPEALSLITQVKHQPCFPFVTPCASPASVAGISLRRLWANSD
jgi:hypothetical protein